MNWKQYRPDFSKKPNDFNLWAYFASLVSFVGLLNALSRPTGVSPLIILADLLPGITAAAALFYAWGYGCKNYVEYFRYIRNLCYGTIAAAVICFLFPPEIAASDPETLLPLYQAQVTNIAMSALSLIVCTVFVHWYEKQKTKRK